jgi:hypothetical protein
VRQIAATAEIAIARIRVLQFDPTDVAMRTWLRTNGIDPGTVRPASVIEIDVTGHVEWLGEDHCSANIPTPIELPAELAGKANLRLRLSAWLPAAGKCGFSCQISGGEVQAGYAADAEERAVAQLRAAIEDQLRPPCVASGCGEDAQEILIAAEPGRLAGKTWQPGDDIDLCWAHRRDVLRAQGVYGLDELVEWLQPDAKLDQLDEYDAESSYAGIEIRRSRSRVLAVHRDHGFVA